MAADIVAMANHINVCEKNDKLNGRIRAGDPVAVDLIRNVPDKNLIEYYDAYSFATKYCSWSNPEAYPIVDGYTKAMVYHLSCHPEIRSPESLNNKQTHLLKYKGFCNHFYMARDWINSQCKRIDGSTYRTKDIDKLLWYYAARKERDANIYI